MTNENVEISERLIDKVVADSEVLIKSKSRVEKNGEVFTPRNIVRDMLNLDGIKDISYNLDTTFLEPACGNGNFIVQIIARKLSSVRDETFDRDVIQAISTVYGVDIEEDNVCETRERVLDLVKYFYETNGRELSQDVERSITYILNRNIIFGNTLTCEKKEEERIKGVKRNSIKKLYDQRPCGEELMSISEWQFDGDDVTRKDIFMTEMVDGRTENYYAVYEPVNMLDISSLEDMTMNIDGML
ncbi:MAG: hypothetical protein IJ593_06310 [Lachnospiraceae bacterium]|nr:hypothetical protein [Lachnospiraceae bacterium]